MPQRVHIDFHTSVFHVGENGYERHLHLCKQIQQLVFFQLIIQYRIELLQQQELFVFGRGRRFARFREFAVEIAEGEVVELMFALGLQQVVGDLHVPEGAFRLHTERPEVLVGVLAVVHDHGARLSENQLYKLLIVTMFALHPMIKCFRFVHSKGETSNTFLLEEPRKEDCVILFCGNIFNGLYLNGLWKLEDCLRSFGLH